jgi:Cu2+-exporting ATPase
MLAAAGTLARQGVLVRRLQAFEALATVDVVVFDKTGTLTCDALALSAIRCREGYEEQQVLAMADALASQSRHPVSRAIAQAAQGIPASLRWQVREATETAGEGIRGDAAPVAGSIPPVALRLGSAAYCGVAAPDVDVLCATLGDDRGWLATFELREVVRPDACATVQALRRAGLDVWLLSGDGQAAVSRVAQQVGIGGARGQCGPQAKLDALREAQKQGRRLAMVGDGLNDGPVLAGADVSFSFGQAVPLAMAQSDFVLPGDRLMAVPQTIALARRTMGVVRQNLLWAALYNATCVPLAVVGWLPAWAAGLGMAASSLLVIANALRLANPRALDGARIGEP